MANTPRPPKARGTRSYHQEVLLGKPDILDTELDLDFDTIYGTVNGHLIDENVQAGAAIDYSKLNLTGRIKQSDLASGFQIPVGAIPAGAVDTPQLKDGAVTKAKIAPGQSLWNPPQVATHPGPNPTLVPFGELVLCTIAYTPRSYTYLQGFIVGQMQITAGGGAAATVSLVIRDGAGGLIAQTDYPVNLDANTPVVSYTIPAFGNSLASGPFTLRLAAAGGNINVSGSLAQLHLIEPS